MAKKAKATAQPNGQEPTGTQVAPAPRASNGTWLPGFSGRQGVDAARARKALNADTIRAMHEAFREGGEVAIRKVMTTQPAIFLKLLVLLVPRELEVTHSAGVKGMSDEQIDSAIAAIEDMLARRAGGGDASPVLPQIELKPNPVDESDTSPAPPAVSDTAKPDSDSR